MIPNTWRARGGAQKYAEQAQAILNHRDHDLGGIFSSIDQLNGVADPAVVSQLKQGAYLSGFHVSRRMYRTQVGAALRKQALLATLYSPGRNAHLLVVPL